MSEKYLYTMAEEKECENCNFELVRPDAQFMFGAVEKCKDCGDVRRQEQSIEHLGLPRQVRELTEE